MKLAEAIREKELAILNQVRALVERKSNGGHQAGDTQVLHAVGAKVVEALNKNGISARLGAQAQ